MNENDLPADLPVQDFARLWRTLERLLAPDGCPWDREQTSEDIARHAVEEAHEWLEACSQRDTAGMVDELGDLNYLVLFGMMALSAEEGIDPGKSLASIDAKLKRRHPHIFGEESQAPVDSAEQLGVWEAVKREERRSKGDDEVTLKKLPSSMGALARSHRYQEKAARLGFDWPDLVGVLAKLSEELTELNEEISELAQEPPEGRGSPSERYRRALAGTARGKISEEIGDTLFVIANLCRWLGLDAEEVAERANEKFRRRFTAMEQHLNESGSSLATADLDEMESHWQAVKDEERS